MKVANKVFDSHEQVETEMLRIKASCLAGAPSCVAKSEKIFTFYLRQLIIACKPFLNQVSDFNKLLKFEESVDQDLHLLKTKNEEYQRQAVEHQAKMEVLENNIKQLQHSLMTSQNELEKEKGLLQQK